MREQTDILLINRDMDFLEAMAGFLGKAGFTVHTAMDMRSALARMSKSPIGLIICDNVLQDVSGYDFLNFIKNDPLREGIPFVFFVPINDQGRAFKAFELGAVDFLVYPMEVDDFVKRIEEIMAEKQNAPPEGSGSFAENDALGETELPAFSPEAAASSVAEPLPPPREEPAEPGPSPAKIPAEQEKAPAHQAVAAANVRVDISRDNILWMPGQIKNFTPDGILVVTALLGKPGVELSVRFRLEETPVTIKGKIRHVVFDNCEKPVGMGIAFDKGDEWSAVSAQLAGIAGSEEDKDVPSEEEEKRPQKTVELSPEDTGTLLLPAQEAGLTNTLLLNSEEDEPEERSFDLRFYFSLVGKQLDNYRAVSFIGAGTMGGVFKGWDAALERVVALKVISYELSAQDEFREMFIKEARLISKLDHPHIAHIYSIGNPNDILYFAMEFIAGDTLADLIKKHQNLYTLRALDYLITVCETLEFVRQKSIIHRDIKPENIIINDAGVLKIVDFGVAKNIEVHASADGPEGIVGSPLYISPDSITRDAVDHRSDIYSLGATFYHVFTGSPPFEGKDTKETLLKHVNETLIPLHERNSKISPTLSGIIGKMMAKDPDQRYQNYPDIIRDLRAFRSRVVQAKKQNGTLRPQAAQPHAH